MARSAVFPGSFDPMTLGHVDIIARAAKLFDKVYVAVGTNTSKQYMLPHDRRLGVMQDVFAGTAGIEVVAYNELTVDLCRRLGAAYLVRGLRSGTDFDYERSIALTNQSMNPDLETVFFISDPRYAGLTSTIVREVYKYGGDISGFVPKAVYDALKQIRQG